MTPPHLQWLLPCPAILGLLLGISNACAKSPETHASAVEAGTYDLRAYGKLHAKERREGDIPVTRLTAENVTAAGIVYSKFISDFTTLATVKEEKRIVGNVTVNILAFDGGRRLLPIWRKTDPFFDIYAFASEEQLGTFLRSNTNKLKNTVLLQKRGHRLYMDLWDRRNMGFWYSPGFKAITKDRTDDQDLDFLRPMLLNINTVGSGLAAVALRSDRNDLGFKINVWFDVSNYAYDDHPEAITMGDPDITHLSNYYGDAPLADNPIRRAQSADILAKLSQFTPDDHLMTITDPHGETAALTESAYIGATNRDEYSRKDFIHYLRDLRKLNLAEVGKRWYGDASRFQDWDDVQFPRERDFYGWKNGASQSLSGTWCWRRIPREQGVHEGFFEPSFDDTKWYAYQQPGTEYLAASASHKGKEGGWMRCSFTPASSLLERGKPIYLTVCPFNNAPYDDPSTVYLNGRKIADLSFGHGEEWGQIEVTSLLKPGTNNLTFYTQSGNMRGPVFLTTEKAEEGFPTRNPQLNARRFDINEWIADNASRAVARSASLLRSIDPVRGIKLMAPHDIVDIIMPYMEEWGLYPHCTGEGAFFRPWLRRNGYLHGIMASCEPAASPKDLKGLKRMFFTFTMEGTNGLDYFYHLHDLLINPEKKDWYEKNLPYYRLAGKFDLKKPDIAIAWSLRSDRYGVINGSSYLNDPGRGDLQQAHYSYVYGSEKDLLAGRLDDYKVLLDDNFHTLQTEEVDALEDWVRNGGILILNQRSGRNTILEPKAWPINRISGCKPAIRPQEGTLTFEKNPSILKAFAGKTFKNYGETKDFQGRNFFSDSISLEPLSKDVEVLARYDDGKPAIVLRTLGRGKVVVLGSAFYRKTSDVKGYWVGSSEQTAFYKALLGDLGIRPLVESGQENLWAERFIANNGSTEMLILGNQNDTDALKNGEAVWDLGFAPRRIFDPVTGRDIPVKIDGTRVRISGLNLLPYEMAYFAAERTEVPAEENITHWLARQTQMWHAVPAAEPQPQLEPHWPISIEGKFQLRQTGSEALARKWMLPETIPDSIWQVMLAADWASSGLKQAPGLWAVYRKPIEIDASWLNDLRGVEMMFSSAVRSLWDNVREVTINGQIVYVDNKIAEPKKILDALQPGKNEVAILTASDRNGNGGFYGELALRRIPGASGESLNLSKGWIAYPTEVDPQSIDLPKAGKWLWVKKQVLIPEKYRNCDAWIEIEGSAFIVSTNGQVRYTSNAYGAKFSPNPLLVNITPDIHFGQKNDIVVLGANLKYTLQPGRFEMKSAKLIFVPEK